MARRGVRDENSSYGLQMQLVAIRRLAFVQAALHVEIKTGSCAVPFIARHPLCYCHCHIEVTGLSAGP